MKEKIKIDFLHDRIHYNRKAHRGKQEIIAKALGAAKGITHVIDLTCGLAEDAFFLTQLGFQVTAIERSSDLYLILQEAYDSALNENPENIFLQRLKIIFSDAKQYLKSSEFSSLPKEKCALYLDPMFPEKKKAALPRKQMQLFRQLIGDDNDSEDLLRDALQSGVSRVVVKRPIKAEPLLKSPIHSFKGKTVRYDLYMGEFFNSP